MEDKEKKAFNSQNISIIISLLACIAAVSSAISSCKSSQAAQKSANIAEQGAKQDIEINKLKFRPYVKIKLINNKLFWDKEKTPYHITLPYQLENTGSAPAYNVRKGYKSYIIDKISNEEKLIQDCPDPEHIADVLVPSESSAVHPDSINIYGFNPSDIDRVYIKVELKSTYQGPSEIDPRTCHTKLILKLIPKIESNSIVFFVYYSRPSLDFGFEKEKKENDI